MRYILFVIFFFCFTNSWAQLSDKELQTLAERVRSNYEMIGVGDGAKVYQTSKHRVLVSMATIDSNMKNSMKNRQAQIKTARAASEFLKGAMNKSITINDAFSDNSEMLTDNKANSVNESVGTINSKTSSNVSEISSSVEREIMSDKIIQQSLAKIDGMQPLMKFDGDEGTVYAYYMLISRKTAKKKY